MEIIDTHAHLDHLKNCLEALIEAKDAGVTGIVAVSETVDACIKNLEIKRLEPAMPIHCAFGIHPSSAGQEDVEECVELIREYADDLVAIGEIGLDFWYKWVRKDDQLKKLQCKTLETLCQLALELDKPVVIHSRGAWRQCLEIVRQVGIKKAVFHWYSGPIDVLDEILAQGFYVSATPALAYSPQLRDAMLHAPIERTLIETDTPVRYRVPLESEDQNKKEIEEFLSTPKDVWCTLNAYCALKQIDKKEACEILNQNARDFFRL